MPTFRYLCQHPKGVCSAKNFTKLNAMAADPLDIYLSWKRKYAAIGCVFARFLATKPTPGQREVVIKGTEPQTIAQETAKQIAGFVDGRLVFAATLVFPDVDTLSTVTKVALALEAEPLWTVTRRIISATPEGDVVAFNVVREVAKEDGGTCPSESLYPWSLCGVPANS